MTYYDVIDRQTGQTVSTHQTRRAATVKADRLDQVHGGYRYYVCLNGPDTDQ